jgi:small conductance mechanosensitive channel
VESVAAESVVVRVEAQTAPGKAALVSRALRQRMKASFDLAGIKLKEEAAAAAAKPTAPEVAPPSALSDPNSAKALSTKPIPIPASVQHQLDDLGHTN